MVLSLTSNKDMVKLLSGTSLSAEAFILWINGHLLNVVILFWYFNFIEQITPFVVVSMLYKYLLWKGQSNRRKQTGGKGLWLTAKEGSQMCHSHGNKIRCLYVNRLCDFWILRVLHKSCYCLLNWACGGTVGWGTALQTGRSRVEFLMVSLEFLINVIILSATLWPWGWLSL
jgi:hypothetical protein